MDCKLDINHLCHAVAKGTWNKSCHYPGLKCNTVSSFDNLTLQKKKGNLWYSSEETTESNHRSRKHEERCNG